MKILYFILILVVLARASEAQMTHEAWLDSAISDTYIGMEVVLDEVEMSASRTPSESAAFGFYKNNPLNSTEEILSRLSAVSMVRRGNYAAEPTINGLNGGQINVAIDGMRMFGACTDKMDPVSSYVEPNNLESISIEKGSSGSEHGSTVGGAVSFNLKKPKFNNEWSGNINSRYESVSHGMGYSGSLNYGTNNLAIRMNGGYRDYGDYTDGNGDEVYHSGYKKLNYSLAAAFKTRSNNLVNFDFLMDDASDVGYPGLPMDVAYAKAKMVGLSYVLWEPLPFVDQLEVKGYYNAVNHLMDDSKRIGLVMRMDMPGETQTMGAFAVADLTRESHQVKVKLDWYSTNAYAEMTMFMEGEEDMFMLTWPDVDRHVVGFFVTDEIIVNEKTKLNLSLRTEQANSKVKSEMGINSFSIFGYEQSDMMRNDFVINTGLEAKHELTKGLTGRIGFSYGDRLPTVSEAYGFYLYNSEDGYDYVGSPDISKESSYQLSCAINYLSTGPIQFNLNLFQYWFNDYIIGNIDESLDAMTIGSKGVKIYENVSGVTFSGFDAQVIYSPVKEVQLLYSVKATYATDGQGDYLPLIPPLKNNLTLVGQTKGYKLQLEGELTNRQDRIRVASGEQSTNGYFLMNIRAGKELTVKEIDLNFSFGVENVFDTSYREHLDWGGILRPGRNLYGSLEVRF